MKSNVVSALDDRQIPLRISRTDHAIDPALVVKQALDAGECSRCAGEAA